MTIGIGITTRNRNELVVSTRQRIEELTPGAKIVVVDDASDKPVDGATFRFDRNVGIPAAKNKCLELLDDCEHIFLFDDDAYPVQLGWELAYIESPEPHLMFQFEDLAGPTKLRDITLVGSDERHLAYSGARGVMLYIERRVLDIVGGIDTCFGKGMYEHGDWSNRIHAAGLTTWRFADVRNSDQLIHSMDQHLEVERSVPRPERNQQVKRNVHIFNERRDNACTDFVDYRWPTGENVVVTHLLTSQIDPQRGTKWNPDPSIVNDWAQSIRGGSSVLLADEATESPEGCALFRVHPLDGNVYLNRWQHTYQHLRDHPEIGWVWVTDGSDVQMLNQPWEHMVPGRLYLGSEPSTLNNAWMKANHPARRYQRLFRDHADKPLLNAGLVGGDRTTVMRFAQNMVTEAADLHAMRFWKLETPGTEIGDMAALNLVANNPRWRHRVITGHPVHTRFRANDTTNPEAWWRHK